MIPQEKMAAVTLGLREAFGATGFSDIRAMTKGLSTDLVFRIVVRGSPYLPRVITRIDERSDPVRHFTCVNAADEYVEKNGVASRLHFVPGSFFDQLLGHILHDWGLEDKRMLIRKAYVAVPEGGALIDYESIIDDDRSKNAFGLMMSLNMLIESPAGFDYTGADCQGWMRDAGFRETRVEHLVGPDSMVVGVR
jgi:hypothetical protein